MKRDRDDTDLRAVRESNSVREKGCVFCELQPEPIISQNELAVVIRDGYPVTQLHNLMIPKRHVSDFFRLGTSYWWTTGHLGRPECAESPRQVRHTTDLGNV